MDVPRITYYAKVIDNLTNQDITNYKNAMDNAFWYYGKINNTLGGESQYIVEFDIWNNEPSFNHRTFDVHCNNAKNVKLSIDFDKEDMIKNDEDYSDSIINVPFFYAKSLTNGYEEDFKLVDSHNKLDIVGNLEPEKKMLLGSGDHCIVQTKIKITNDYNLTNKRYNFNVVLSYDFE